MIDKDDQGIQSKKRRSFTVTLLNRLAAFIYSLFTETWVGRSLSKCGDMYEKSAIGRFLSGENRQTHKDDSFRRSLSAVLERGIVARTAKKLSYMLANMSVNVYGMFFAVYGIASVITYFITVYAMELSAGMSSRELVACIIITVCSIPFLASQKSVSEMFCSGKIPRKIAVSYLCISEDKFASEDKINGTIAMLIAGVLGVSFGACSFLLSPIAVIFIFLVINLLFLIFAIPETGILISVIALPFMQYVSFSDVIIVSLVVFTALAYILKVLRGNRTFSIAAPGVMVILYCICMIVAGCFSKSGADAILPSLAYAFVVAGGFFLGSDITKKTNIRNVCIKTLMVSLVALSILQFWNAYYMSISSGIEYSLNFDYRSIIVDAGLNVNYNVRLPGLLAAMLAPLLIAECFRQKRVYHVVALVLCFVPVIFSIALYGTLEVMLALILGVVLYLILYSHKTLTASLLFAVPIAVAVMLMPTVLALFHIDSIPTLKQAVDMVFPNNSSVATQRACVVNDAISMLRDGNLFGIGAGENVFFKMLSPYASSVSESASDMGSMYVQIACEAGILGLVIFSAFALMLITSALRYVIRSFDNNERKTTLALMCGFATAILLGIVCCIYTDTEMRFLFWLCAGMLQGQVIKAREKEKQLRSHMDNDEYSMDISIKI